MCIVKIVCVCVCVCHVCVCVCHVCVPRSGNVFIDRSAELFEWVLHSLRTGIVQSPTHMDPSGALLRHEMNYFQIDSARTFTHHVTRCNGVGVKAPGVDLNGAVLDGLCVRDSNLMGAKMRGVCLKGAVLEGCNMSLADLSGADLSRASLAGSDLTNADLSGQSHVLHLITQSHNHTQDNGVNVR